MQSRAVTPQ